MQKHQVFCGVFVLQGAHLEAAFTRNFESDPLSSFSASQPT